MQVRYSHQKTVPYTPQQNGVVEEKTRSLVKMARCMLYCKGSNKCYWDKSIHFSNYILNRVPTKEVLQATPKEKWNESKCNITLSYLIGNFI